MVALCIHLICAYIIYKYYIINYQVWSPTNFFMIFYMIEIFLFLAYFDTEVYVSFYFLFFGFFWMCMFLSFIVYFFSKMVCISGMIFSNKTLVWWESLLDGLVVKFYTALNKRFFNKHSLDRSWYKFQLKPRKYKFFWCVSVLHTFINIILSCVWVCLAVWAFNLQFLELALYVELYYFWLLFGWLTYRFIKKIILSWYFKTDSILFLTWALRFDDDSGFLDYIYSDQYVIEEVILSQQTKGIDVHQFLSDMSDNGVIDPTNPRPLMSWDNPETYGRFYLPLSWIDYFSEIPDRPVACKFTRSLARYRDTVVYYIFVPSAMFKPWVDVENLPDSPDYENNLRRFI